MIAHILAERSSVAHGTSVCFSICGGLIAPLRVDAADVFELGAVHHAVLFRQVAVAQGSTTATIASRSRRK